MTFSTQQMLDNAATASQERGLLEPTTRGAVLRSMVQWITAQPEYDDFFHALLIERLEADEEFNL